MLEGGLMYKGVGGTSVKEGRFLLVPHRNIDYHESLSRHLQERFWWGWFGCTPLLGSRLSFL